MSEILGTESTTARRVRSWGKYVVRPLNAPSYVRYYCPPHWSGIGIQVWRKRTADTDCCICGRQSVPKPKHYLNQAAD